MALWLTETSLAADSPSTGSLDLLSRRLRNLSGIYSLLVHTGWASVGLRALATQQFGMFDGVAVSLRPKAAIVLGVALYELAISAMRRGALSVPEGRVRLGWAIVAEPGDGEPEQLEIEWRETSPPDNRGAEYAGFTRTLIENQLAADIGATGEVEPRPEGFTCGSCCRWQAAL